MDALIPSGTDAQSGPVATADIDALVPNPLQPRTRWDESQLEELTESVRAHGIIQPIVVTHRGGARPYQIIAGERRWRAAQRAGLSSVPVLVREATAAEALELALIENIQRADLNPIEEALAYRHLTDEFGLTQAQVAERVGRSRPSIANALRLLTAPEDLREAVANDEITAGHAKALLSIPDHERMLHALDRVRRLGLSVRETERLAQTLAQGQQPVKQVPQPNPVVRALQNDLSRAFHTKVEVEPGRRGGRIVIHYFS
ncbi:MAG: stage 0 sporulation protein J, partial [Chloroflexi bacterium]